MRSNRTALVIGGGIAGPTAAMALQKAGIDATVYEAYPAPAHGVGAFLTLASNGVDALRVLAADGTVLDAGFPTPRITLRSGSGKRLGESPLGELLPDGTTSQTLKRADLYRALYQEMLSRGIRVEFGKRLVTAEQSGNRVGAIFADGSVATGDVLIGCDGLHSTVRTIVDPDAPRPRYAGLVGTGGYARGISVGSVPGDFEMIFGKRAFFGYVIAPGDEVWWFANVPHPGGAEVGQVDCDGWSRERLLALFADDAGPAVELIEASPGTMSMTAFHWMPPLRTWHTGRIVVIGDATHAPTPSSGQGASLAIEDAVLLAKCLRDVPDPPTAFARFEELRRPRVERIVRRAVRLNRSKAPGAVGRVVRDAMLPVILAKTANSRALREPFDYHIDWDAISVAA